MAICALAAVVGASTPFVVLGNRSMVVRLLYGALAVVAMVALFFLSLIGA